MKKPPLKHGDVHPAHVLRDEYGLNAANRPTIVVSADEVPAHLRAAIPYAERWAIADDVIRADYFEQQPEQDIAAFWHGLLPHVEPIHGWLDSLPKDVAAWPKAALTFLYLLRAHDRAYQPTDEEKAVAQERHSAWAHERRRDKAIEAALEAFKARNYPAAVELLAPYEAELDNVTTAKFAFARKKVANSTDA